jgi:hypothetical protein
MPACAFLHADRNRARRSQRMNENKRLKQKLKKNWQKTVNILIRLIEMKDPWLLNGLGLLLKT